LAAAGNRGIQEPFFPAAYDGVVGVAATDSDDQRAQFSNYGPHVDIAAPGVDILSTWLAPLDYRLDKGTSMSTPMVSGLAALVWTRYPSATAGQVWAAIRDGADDLGSPGRDDLYGWGRINAERSLQVVHIATAAENARLPLALPSTPTSARSKPAAYRPGEVIVSLRSGPAAMGGELSVLEAGPSAGVYLVRVPAGEEVASAVALRGLSEVVYAHPNYVLSVADR
jgi:subtilisin family serine protease